MDAAEEIEGVEELLPFGHIIHYSKNYTNIGDELPLYFERKFTFHCSVLPTSWWLRVIFETEPNDRGVSCVVVFKRTDNNPVIVEASLCMLASGSSIDPLFPGWLKKQLMQGGSEARHTFADFVPDQVLRQLGDQILMFQFSFDVHSCHPEKLTNVSGDEMF